MPLVMRTVFFTSFFDYNITSCCVGRSSNNVGMSSYNMGMSSNNSCSTSDVGMSSINNCGSSNNVGMSSYNMGMSSNNMRMGNSVSMVTDSYWDLTVNNFSSDWCMVADSDGLNVVAVGNNFMSHWGMVANSNGFNVVVRNNFMMSNGFNVVVGNNFMMSNGFNVVVGNNFGSYNVMVGVVDVWVMTVNSGFRPIRVGVLANINVTFIWSGVAIFVIHAYMVFA